MDASIAVADVEAEVDQGDGARFSSAELSLLVRNVVVAGQRNSRRLAVQYRPTRRSYVSDQVCPLGLRGLGGVAWPSGP